MNKRNLWIVLIAVACVLAALFARAAVRAHRNLVTLRVRNAEVPVVLKSLRWQTWEPLYAAPGITGKVTLNVVDMPLEEVLDIMASQASARWNIVYPIYDDSQALRNLKRIATGGKEEDKSSWSSWSSRSGRGGGAVGMFGAAARGANPLVSMQVEKKDAEFASLALSRFSHALVVVQDGTLREVTLTLSQVPMPAAVDALARQLGRKWTHFYLFRAGGRPPQAQVAGGGEERPRREFGGQTPRAPDPERQAEREKQIAAAEATMTPEEKAQAQKRRQQWEEMRNLTPEERQQKMAERMSSPEMQTRAQNRMLNGLKNSTPDQRVERDQRRVQRQKTQQKKT